MNIYDTPSFISKTQAKTSFAVFLEGNSGVCFEGKYKIEKFYDSEVLLKLSAKQKIKIIGHGLKIGTLAPFEIGINGIISSIEFL